MRSLARPIAALALTATLGGCGDARTHVPNATQPLTPDGSATQRFPTFGVDFNTASNWTFTTGQAPLVGVTTSGQAVVAIWRYPRSQALPHTTAQLDAARNALLGAARSRDPGLHTGAARTLRVDAEPAIEVLARETIAGQSRTVRSIHVYAFGAEYVIDAYAPPGYFDRVDQSLFVPLLASLRFTAPVPTTSG